MITIVIEGYEITILDGPYLSENNSTEEGQKFAKAIISEIPNAKIAAAEKLLSLYNETWLDESIGTLTKEGFIERLVNPSIALYDEIGCAVLYFKASEMFTDHAIEVGFEEGEIDFVSII